jgi:hypothetical protein
MVASVDGGMVESHLQGVLVTPIPDMEALQILLP